MTRTEFGSVLCKAAAASRSKGRLALLKSAASAGAGVPQKNVPGNGIMATMGFGMEKELPGPAAQKPVRPAQPQTRPLRIPQNPARQALDDALRRLYRNMSNPIAAYRRYFSGQRGGK